LITVHISKVVIFKFDIVVFYIIFTEFWIYVLMAD